MIMLWRRRAHRQQVDREIATINRGVPDADAPRVQPRSQSMSEISHAIYPHLNSDATDRAREQYEQWQERLMPWGFTRKK
jgi:hypothetical protein